MSSVFQEETGCEKISIHQLLDGAFIPSCVEDLSKLRDLRRFTITWNAVNRGVKLPPVVVNKASGDRDQIIRGYYTVVIARMFGISEIVCKRKVRKRWKAFARSCQEAIYFSKAGAIGIFICDHIVNQYTKYPEGIEHKRTDHSASPPFTITRLILP